MLDLPDSVAENYNFGERPPTNGEVIPGQTATIGFWQNKNGQGLLEALNGGPLATQLSEWLGATFPNLYGTAAGESSLLDADGDGDPTDPMTNVEVADSYSALFRRKKKEALAQGLGGPTKVDAQVMAVAFATYVTNETLAGTTAVEYGFLVTEYGVGTSTFNVGTSGQAFDVDNDTLLAVLDLLFATDNMSTGGVLYDRDGDGDADDDLETLLRMLANDVYSAINEQGDV